MRRARLAALFLLLAAVVVAEEAAVEDILLKQAHKSSLSIVILGGAGDLAKRKLYPSLCEIVCGGQLDASDTTLVAMGSSALGQEVFKAAVKANVPEKQQTCCARLLNGVYYLQGKVDDPAAMNLLDMYLDAKEGPGASRLFYLSLPPSVYGKTVKSLSAVTATGGAGFTRLVLEKPFGRDTASATALIKEINGIFPAKDLYKVDHYLHKGPVRALQNIRHDKAVDAVWSADNVEKVEIILKETLDVQGRGSYFCESGIIRDVIQNHVMQVLSLLTMDHTLKNLTPSELRKAKIDIVKQIRAVSPQNVTLAQYKGFREDPSVPKDCLEPTYAKIRLFVDNERWAGVPFILEAGKAMDESTVSVHVHFRGTRDSNGRLVSAIPYRLRIDIQPNFRVALAVWTQGQGIQWMDLNYNAQTTVPRSAYAQVFLDVINGDSSWFAHSDEILGAWRVFDAVLSQTATSASTPLPMLEYPIGARTVRSPLDSPEDEPEGAPGAGKGHDEL